jgi:hypothetical protein
VAPKWKPFGDVTGQAKRRHKRLGIAAYSHGSVPKQGQLRMEKVRVVLAAEKAALDRAQAKGARLESEAKAAMEEAQAKGKRLESEAKRLESEVAAAIQQSKQDYQNRITQYNAAIEEATQLQAAAKEASEMLAGLQKRLKDGRGLPLQLGDAVECVAGGGILASIDGDNCVVDIGGCLVKLKLKMARLRHQPISFGPPPRCVRCDAKATPEVVKDIHAYLHLRCQEAPGKNDFCSRFLGPYRKEQARILFRYEKWDQLWMGFTEAYPATAAKITLNERPTKCPHTFRENAPWNIRDGRRDTCLCRNCEHTSKHNAARRAVGEKLNIALVEPLQAGRKQRGDEKLRTLIAILSAHSKREMCQEATCNARHDDTGVVGAQVQEGWSVGLSGGSWE